MAVSLPAPGAQAEVVTGKTAASGSHGDVPERGGRAVLQQNDLIVVSCEQAPRGHFGDNGVVLSVSGNKVTYLPERTGGATKVTVPLHMALKVVPNWPNRAP